MIDLTSRQINEIADKVEKDMLCFYHIPSGKLIVLPSRVREVKSEADSEMVEDEELQRQRKQLEIIESKLANYISFEKMSSRKSYDVMRSFALASTHATIKENLLHSLKKHKPHRSFEKTISTLPEDVIQAWEKFKLRKARHWVEEQLELYDF